MAEQKNATATTEKKTRKPQAPRARFVLMRIQGENGEYVQVDPSRVEVLAVTMAASDLVKHVGKQGVIIKQIGGSDEGN